MGDIAWRRRLVVLVVAVTAFSTMSLSRAAADTSDPIVGDWSVTYGAPAIVTMTLSNGTYTVTAKTPVRVTGSSCDLPIGTDLASFSSTGGNSYSGFHGLWYTSDCSLGFYDPTMFTLSSDGNTLTAVLDGGYGTVVFTKVNSNFPGGELCAAPKIRTFPFVRPQPFNVVIFMDGIGSEENQSGTFYPIPVSSPKAGVPLVTNYCPLDPHGNERDNEHGWPNGLSLNLRRWSEFSVPGGGSGSGVTVGQACDLPGGFYTDSCLVARLADRGAVMLPYSYAGAILKPDGRFNFYAYTANTTTQPPQISIVMLENEIRSINTAWRLANIYIVAHSYAGSVSSHWWEKFHTSEPEVRKVFTLDGTVNGNALAQAGLASFFYGPFVTQLWSDDWNNLFDNSNAATRDAWLLAHDGDQSLVTVGTPDDPTLGLPIEAQVLVDNCTSGPFHFHCDPVSPPSVVSNCSAQTPAIYGIGGGNDGHDVVKVCPMVVRLIVAALG